MSDIRNLETYVQYLNSALNSYTQETNHLEMLSNLSSLLQHTDYKCAISVSQSIISCSRCEQNCTPGIQFPCGHVVCSLSCLKSLIESCTRGLVSNYKNVQCSKCGMQIPRSIIIFVIGGEEEFQFRINEEHKLPEPKKNCEICFESKLMSDFVTLACGHEYCSDCMRTYINTQIEFRSSAEDALTCPQDEVPIDHSIIKAYLNPIEYQELELQPVKWEKVYFCPWCACAIECLHGRYITCHSKVCKGKKHFCNLCMTKLNFKRERHACYVPKPTRRCVMF